MKRIVAIPKLGNVGFPDEMSDDEVSQAVAKLQQQHASQSTPPGPSLRSFATPSNRQPLRNVLVRKPK